MDNIKVVIMYILSIFIVSIVGSLFGFLLILIPPLRLLLTRLKSLLYVFTLSINIASNFFAVFLIVSICNKLNIQPTLLMVIIPGILSIRNGNSRIKRAKEGASNVKNMLDNSGEPESYDQKSDIKTEYINQIGDIVGLILGALYFLYNAPLY
jgi:hypothetical protein